MTATTSKALTITLTGRAPIKIRVDEWPEIASATERRHDGEIESQANRISKAAIRVREHADGRTIVYGSYSYDTSWQHESSREIRGGLLLDPHAGSYIAIVAKGKTPLIDAIEDVAEQLSERVGEEYFGLDMVELGQQCMADLPAVEI